MLNWKKLEFWFDAYCQAQSKIQHKLWLGAKVKPMVEEFSTYKWRVNKKEHLDPRDYGLSKIKFRHLKVLDLLDESSHWTRGKMNLDSPIPLPQSL